MNDISAINLFLEAGLVVKSVMVILLLISIISWIIIFERYLLYRKIKNLNVEFENQFWSGADLNILFEEVNNNQINLSGSSSVFRNAFKEFNRLKSDNNVTELDLEGINRSMRVAIARDEEEMLKHLPFLANAGSVSPYIGLFGTVWGIMTSFQGLSDATQATINAVAPGISEALIATAMGLFAAIPAVVAFNRFTSQSDSISQSTTIFAEELASIFYRQVLKNKK
jgi:biopolymer transport protein TolQ|tara:strand:+ start:5957 stop:6634 length:678 start_codon:yes stop_codon:yes gene_type:complete